LIVDIQSRKLVQMTHEMTRRNVLAAGAAFIGTTLARASAAPPERRIVDPSHDTSFSAIPARDRLVQHLSAEAREAQERPRVIKGFQVTGLPHSLPELDDRVIQVLRESGIPGASICVAKDQKLVCTRGYGRASMVGNVTVEPTMPATIMSISKPLTVTAALTLVRDGKLGLDDLAFGILKEAPLLRRGESVDPRMHKITVRQLMSHTSGLFNAVESLNDPAFFQALARQRHIQLLHGRIGQNDLVRLGMREKLLFDPGRKFAYSGQGMQVLGRIVEKLSGLRLDKYIHRAVCVPLMMRSYYVGSYLHDDQYRQYMNPHRERLYTMCPSIYDKNKRRHHPQNLPKWDYISWGGADACGWGSMNAIDLLRFVTFYPDLIGPELWKATLKRPSVENDKGERVKSTMGLGWGVHGKSAETRRINHGGGWAGERSFAERRPDGSIATLVNSDDDPHIDQINKAAGDFLKSIESVEDQSPKWSDYGLAAGVREQSSKSGGD
jgi:CubicO group peptidase (beta-lactamase class C family)